MLPRDPSFDKNFHIWHSLTFWDCQFLVENWLSQKNWWIFLIWKFYYTKDPLGTFLLLGFFSLLSQILDCSLWPNYTVVNISRVHTIWDDKYPISNDLWVGLFKNIFKVSVTFHEGCCHWEAPWFYSMQHILVTAW